MNAEIVAVGTELLLGQIANTNAQWISQQLARCGLNMYHHTVVGDNLERVRESFKTAQMRSDIVIVTGGLGPTEDDMTREAFQKLTHLKMFTHQPSMKKIEHYYAKKNKTMTENNRRQARVFLSSKVILNDKGMAPGMILTYKDVIWVFLPGVPHEMKSMIHEDVIPYIQSEEKEQETILSEMLLFVGIGESKLEDDLKDLIDRQTNPTIAPLAQETGVALRITAKARDIKEAKQYIANTKYEILLRVGEFYVGEDISNLYEELIKRLKGSNLKIGAAESLTGGLFSEQIVSISGASEIFNGSIVCYHSGVKTNVLGVSKDVIDTYGTVSEECATHMAKKVKDMMNTDIGISFTGLAGPDAVEGKEVGTVFIGVQFLEEEKVFKFIFNGDRQKIRKSAALKGAEILLNFLKSVK